MMASVKAIDAVLSQNLSLFQQTTTTKGEIYKAKESSLCQDKAIYSFRGKDFSPLSALNPFKIKLAELKAHMS